MINGPAKQLLTQIGAKKRRGKDALMLFSFTYFFAPFSIFYIPHNSVIPQAMPHAIPQTHSFFYPHRNLRALTRRTAKTLNDNLKFDGRFLLDTKKWITHLGREDNYYRVGACMRQLKFTFLGSLRNMVFAANRKRWNFAKMYAIQARLYIFNPWSG